MKWKKDFPYKKKPTLTRTGKGVIVKEGAGFEKLSPTECSKKNWLTCTILNSVKKSDKLP